MEDTKINKKLDKASNYVLGISVIFLALVLGKPALKVEMAIVVSLILFSVILGAGLVMKKYNLTRYFE
jgi:hypothetical protein